MIRKEKQKTEKNKGETKRKVKGKERKGEERRGEERKGKERKGKERKGEERKDERKKNNGHYQKECWCVSCLVTGEGVPVMAIIRAIAKCSCHQNSAKEKEPPTQTSLWLLKRTDGKCTASKYSCKHSIIASHEKICFLVPRTITLMCWERKCLFVDLFIERFTLSNCIWL